MDVVNNISEKLVSKLLFPFRKGKNLEKIQDIIQDGISDMVKKHDKMYDELREQLYEIKETHIPSPSTGIGNRFRFLFTGKLK